MAGIPWEQEREEIIDSCLQSREDFSLDYLSSLNISFTQKEQEFIAGAYMSFWLENYITFDGDQQNPPSCKGTPFELWGLIQYYAVYLGESEREQYRKRIDIIREAKISDDVWGQLMKQFSPRSQQPIEPLTEEIFKKITRSFHSFKQFEGFNLSLPKSDKQNMCPVMKAIRPFLRDFPLKTDDLKYAYPSLSKRRQDLTVSHTRLLFAQYIGNVVYVSPDPIGTPMEIWFLLKISQKEGIISQQKRSTIFDMATRCLGEVYRNPRNPEDHNNILGWIDFGNIMDILSLWKYNDFLEAQQSPPADPLEKRGMYVA